MRDIPQRARTAYLERDCRLTVSALLGHGRSRPLALPVVSLFAPICTLSPALPKYMKTPSPSLALYLPHLKDAAMDMDTIFS